MDLTTNLWMMIAGGLLAVLGYLLRSRMSRYDLTDAAIGSAWQLARGKRSADNPTEVERKLKNIGAAPTAVGKAGRAAGSVIGHVAAQVLGLVAWVMMLAGAALLAAGYFWT
jgi:hypothetical protein